MRPFGPGSDPLERVIENPPQSRAVPLTRGLGGPVSPDMLGLPPEIAQRMNINAPRLSGTFTCLTFLAQAASAVAVPEQINRRYLFILNLAAAARAFIGFGFDPNAGNGLILEQNLGFYEPWIVPTNEIRISAAAANTPVFIALVNIRPDQE